MFGLKNIWKRTCTREEARFLLLACLGRSPHFDAELDIYTELSFFGALKKLIHTHHFRRTVLDPATLEKRPLTMTFRDGEKELIARMLKQQFEEFGRTPETWLRLMRLMLKNGRFQKAVLTKYDAESLQYLNQFYAQRKTDDALELRAEVHQRSPRVISIHIAAETELPSSLSLYINGEAAGTVDVPKSAQSKNVDFDHRFRVPKSVQSAEEGTLSLFSEPGHQLLCPSIDVALSVTKPVEVMRRVSLELERDPTALEGLRDRLPTVQQYASLRLEDYGSYASFYRPGKPSGVDELPKLLLVTQGDAVKLKRALAPALAQTCHVVSADQFSSGGQDITKFDFLLPVLDGAQLDSYLPHWLGWARKTAPSAPIIRFGYDHMAENGERCDPIFPCRFDPFRANQDDPQSIGYAISACRWSGWKKDQPDLDLFSVDTFNCAYTNSDDTGGKDYIPHILMTLPRSPTAPQETRDGARPLLGVPIDSAPTTISVIIPTKNRLDLIKPCVESLWATTGQPECLDIMLVDNGSNDPELLQWLDHQKEKPQTTVVTDELPFNWSRLNNLGADRAEGDILLFLNDDTKAVSDGWDEVLRTLLALPKVGVVGAKLLYPDGSLQHGGILLTDDLHVVHEGKNLQEGAGGYADRLQTTHACDAVTGAFLACRSSDFNTAGKFDEDFSITFNDIDFCTRMDRSGFYSVFEPGILFYHFESESRGLDEESPKKLARKQREHALFVKKWGEHYRNQWATLGRAYPEIFDMETAQDFTQLRLPNS